MATKKKKVTLKEFKSWLEGVEELHPNNWHPDADQWKLIRNKIDLIKDEITKPLPQQTIVQQFHPQQSIPNHPITQELPALLSPLTVQPSNVEMTPAAAAVLSGQLPSTMIPAPDGKLHTPNIDTSSDNYNSSFS